MQGSSAKIIDFGIGCKPKPGNLTDVQEITETYTDAWNFKESRWSHCLSEVEILARKKEYEKRRRKIYGRWRTRRVWEKKTGKKQSSRSLP